MYLLPKTHKRLFNVHGRPVISNWGLPTEKVLEFLDSHLKVIIQESWSYIKDSNYFINKMKNLKSIPRDALLTVGVVGLYTSIPHEAGLKALKETIYKRQNRNIATNDVTKMTEFVFNYNYFKCNGQVTQQISSTTNCICLYFYGC